MASSDDLSALNQRKGPQRMDKATVWARMAHVISRQLSVRRAQVQPEASAIHDYGADSLKLVSVISAIEDSFGVELSDEETQRSKSLGELRDLVVQKLAKEANA
jgi:acyl carrier protein